MTDAVNTVIVEQGGLLGDDTDGYGFTASRAAGAPDWRAG
jgi:shikimate 5-dehydrogenase